MEKNRILTDMLQKTDTENQKAEKGKSKYSERTLENKTVRKRVITVGSCEEEHWEIVGSCEEEHWEIVGSCEEEH